MKRTFKVGDRVKIRKDLGLNEGCNNAGHYISTDMLYYKGKEAIITRISESNFGSFREDIKYFIDIDNGVWAWSDEMLEQVKSNTEKKEEYVTKAEFEEFKKSINKLIEKNDDKKETDRAKVGSNYYYIDSCGGVCVRIDYYDDVDNCHYKMGNYYLTEEECQRAKEIKDILNKYSYNFSTKELEDTNITKKYYLLVYNHLLTYNPSLYGICATRLFKNEEDCQQVIKEIGYQDYIKYCVRGGIK